MNWHQNLNKYQIMSNIIRKVTYTVLFVLVSGICSAQGNFRTEDLFRKNRHNSRAGRLVIHQDQRIDTLISRHILNNSHLDGLEGYRIQIYNSSARNAREESAKVRADFINLFPDIPSYSRFDAPGYYKIRAGDFRTKAEGTKYLLMVRRSFPDAYLVPDIINFSGQNTQLP